MPQVSNFTSWAEQMVLLVREKGYGNAENNPLFTSSAAARYHFTASTSSSNGYPFRETGSKPEGPLTRQDYALPFPNDYLVFFRERPASLDVYEGFTDSFDVPTVTNEPCSVFLDCPTLYMDFCSLRTYSAIVSFAKKYGRLGIPQNPDWPAGRFVFFPRWDEAERMDWLSNSKKADLTSQHVAILTGPHFEAESIYEWGWEIGLMRACGYILEAIREDHWSPVLLTALRPVVQDNLVKKVNLVSIPGIGLGGANAVIYSTGVREGTTIPVERFEEYRVDLAAKCITELVEEKLRGQITLEFGNWSKSLTVAQAELRTLTLLGALWAQFANTIASNNKISACLKCGKPILVSAGTQAQNAIVSSPRTKLSGKRKFCSNACRQAQQNTGHKKSEELDFSIEEKKQIVQLRLAKLYEKYLKTKAHPEKYHLFDVVGRTLLGKLGELIDCEVTERTRYIQPVFDYDLLRSEPKLRLLVELKSHLLGLQTRHVVDFEEKSCVAMDSYDHELIGSVFTMLIGPRLSQRAIETLNKSTLSPNMFILAIHEQESGVAIQKMCGFHPEIEKALKAIAEMYGGQYLER